MIPWQLVDRIRVRYIGYESVIDATWLVASQDMACLQDTLIKLRISRNHGSDKRPDDLVTRDVSIPEPVLFE